MDQPSPLQLALEQLKDVELQMGKALRLDASAPTPSVDIEELVALRSVMDRLRPLLWMYLTRVSEDRRLHPFSDEALRVRDTMDAAMTISARYMSGIKELL